MNVKLKSICKKIIPIIPTTIFLFSVMAVNITASDVSSAVYTAEMKVTNTTGATVNNSVASFNLDAEALKNQYYTNSSLSGVAIRNNNNADVLVMPPSTTGSITWSVYTNNIPSGESAWNMYLSQQDMQPKYTLFPGSTGVRAAKSTSLNIGSGTSSWDVELNGIALKNNTSESLIEVGGVPIYEDHITHTSASNFPSVSIACSAYGNGYYLVVVSNSNRVYRSSDALTWQQFNLPVSANWTSMCYGSAGFILTANGNATYYKSTDGINWTGYSSPQSYYQNSRVIYGGATYLMSVDYLGGKTHTSPSTDLYRSSDGTSWTSIGSGSGYNAFKLAACDNCVGWLSSEYLKTYKNNAFLQSNHYATSASAGGALALIATSNNFYIYWYDKNYGYNKLTTCDSSGAYVSSLNAITLSINNISRTGAYAISTNGTNTVKYSTNGKDWSTFTAPVSTNNIIYNNGTYVILGNNSAGGAYKSSSLTSGYTNTTSTSYTWPRLTGQNIKFSYASNQLKIYDNNNLVTTINIKFGDANNYKFTSAGTTLKVDNIKVNVNGATVANWSWNPGGTLLDASGNGNNATTDYISSGYDPNITITMGDIKPSFVNNAQSSGAWQQQVIIDTDQPIVAPDVLEHNWNNIPVLKEIARDLRDNNWPVDLVLSMAVVLIDMLLCFLVYRFTRNQLTSGILAIVFLSYFVVMGCIPLFALVVAIISEIAVMTKRKVISY